LHDQRPAIQAVVDEPAQVLVLRVFVTKEHHVAGDELDAGHSLGLAVLALVPPDPEVVPEAGPPHPQMEHGYTSFPRPLGALRAAAALTQDRGRELLP